MNVMFESDCNYSKAIIELVLGIFSVLIIIFSSNSNPVMLTILVTLSVMCLLDLIFCILQSLKKAKVAKKNLLPKRYGLWNTLIMIVAIITGLSQGLKTVAEASIL